MNTTAAVTYATLAEAASKVREATAMEAANKILAARELTAEIRAGIPARLAEFDLATEQVVTGFDQRITTSESASFDNAAAIADGVVAAEQRKRYLAVRVAERAALLEGIEKEVLEVNKNVPTITQFFGGVRRAEFDAATSVLLPFFREGPDQEMNARGAAIICASVVYPGSEIKDAKDPLNSDRYIQRLRKFVAGEVTKSWLT